MYTELFNTIYGQDRKSGMPRIAIGVLVAGVHSVARWVLMDEDGRIVQCDIDQFVADVRWKDGEWNDVGPGAA